MSRPIGHGVGRHPRPATRHPRRLLWATILGGVLLLALGAGPVLGHAELVSADPEDKVVLGTAPTTVTLTFSEDLDAAKSSFRLVGPSGDAGTGQAVDGQPRVMRLDGLALEPGDYQVRWTAAATDGHIERGRLSFTVLEPTPEPATPGPTVAPTAAASAEPSLGAGSASPAGAAPTPAPVATADPSAAAAAGTPGDIVIPLLAGLAIVGVVGVLVLRRSRAA